MSRKNHKQAPYLGPMSKHKPPKPAPIPPPGPALSIACPVTQRATTLDGSPVLVYCPPAVTTGGNAPITISYSRGPDGPFPLGTTTVTATARSSDGQIATCQFDVVVTQVASTPGLIQPANLQYQGAFRAREGAFGDAQGNGFGFGGVPIAFNPANQSLFVGTHNDRAIAELSIPTPVNSAVLANLPRGSVIQNFEDPTEGNFGPDPTGGTIPAGVGGLVVHNGTLHCAGFIFYDANNSTAVSHFKRNLDLATPSFSGWQALWQLGSQGFVGRALAVIPSEWQTALGGDLLASGWGLPIISRQSYGPNALSFHSADINGSANVVAATPLINYPSDHHTLGDWSNTSTSNPIYNMASDYGGMVIVPGWQSLLIIGRTGLGVPCYGTGTSDPAKQGQPTGEGDIYCYDPADSSKGTHGYQYAYYVWAYDLADLAAVKAGSRNPWDVLPYATWELSLPIAEGSCKGLAATIDPATGTIYVAQLRADPGGGFFSGPIFHAFTVA